MERKNAAPYQPDSADEKFIRLMNGVGAIRTRPDDPTVKELTQFFGNTNYNTLKKWQYRLCQIPKALPYDNKRMAFFEAGLAKLAQNILDFDKEVSRPVYDDENYDDTMRTPVKDFLQPVVSKPKDFDYEYQLTDEDLKNFVPFPEDDE